MSTLQRIALVFTVIGAVNWGLIGFFQFDLVATIFGGQNSALARIIYGIVGISGLINLGLLFKPSENLGTHPKQTKFDNQYVLSPPTYEYDCMQSYLQIYIIR